MGLRREIRRKGNIERERDRETQSDLIEGEKIIQNPEPYGHGIHNTSSIHMKLTLIINLQYFFNRLNKLHSRRLSF